MGSRIYRILEGGLSSAIRRRRRLVMTSLEGWRNTQIKNRIVFCDLQIEKCASFLCAYGCNAKATTGTRRVCFLRSPTKPPIRKKWVEKCTNSGQFVHKNKFDPSTRRICSIHFSPKQFDNLINFYLFSSNLLNLNLNIHWL